MIWVLQSSHQSFCEKEVKQKERKKEKSVTGSLTRLPTETFFERINFQFSDERKIG